MRKFTQNVLYLEKRFKLMLDIHHESKTWVVNLKECSAELSKVKTFEMAFLALVWGKEDCCFEAQNVTESVSFGSVYLTQKFGVFFRGNFALKDETWGITAGFKVIFFTPTDIEVTWLINFNLSVLKFQDGKGGNCFCFIWLFFSFSASFWGDSGRNRK